MDNSSKVAASVPAIIVFGAWALGCLYLLFFERRHGVRTDDKYYYSWTFHVETLRFGGLINFLIMLIIGAAITEFSGLDTIEDPTETVIFELFGINHSCNWVDHNPARMISAILVVPLIQVPLMLYVVIWHCRLRKQCKMGNAPRWLYYMSRCFTPYNLITVAELHLWFVNNPNDTYGFTAHYIPYLMFQIAICLMVMMNICYLTTVRGKLFWGIPPWLAWGYFCLLTALTIFYIVMVVTTLAGVPIVSATRSSSELVISKILTFLWAILAIFGTLVFSGRERLDGDTITLDLGDDTMSMRINNAGGGEGSDEDAASTTEKRDITTDDDMKRLGLEKDVELAI